MPFDKVGKSIKETHQITTQDYLNNDNLIRIINKISKLGVGNKAVFCRWLRLGFMEGVQALVFPDGSVTLTDWSSEIDPLVHDLINNGIAVLNDKGFVEIPYMMTLADRIDLGLACDLDDDSFPMDDEVIYPSPMVMRVPYSKEAIEESYDDLVRSTASAIRRFDHYLGGKIIHVGINVKSLGIMNSVVFRNPIDILVITSNKYLIAHRVLDPSRTVHRGLSALEGYLMDGMDYAVLIHKYTHYEVHVDTFNKIVSRPYVRDAGFAVVPSEFDYIMFFKWPRYNSVMMRSQSVVGKRSLIGNVVNFMLNTR
ncbi:hypothetical protein [Vulcanisaeta souniana]|uniref:Uncharacterized protein n=1 Tax=Vulcanisaeta souniana JCM 11219 TaxID=1293586 RepID=A0A830E849_9CREN|nr:hypothetical protein [Vulcanisaeta souniana]BDR91107.1 hypothetical protein Vsou_02000 [Vulcanisaeta souniana JCM 11219]GGI80842.1 hypothetical protein GCM10007112_17080 [Vulcanisaeta souniana JCM 11219]